MQKYPAYKDSTAPWFGDVPESWDMIRLGAILRERGEKNNGTKTENVLSVLKDIGVINYEDKGDIGNKKSEDIERYKIVHEGDLVLNSMNVIIGSVGMSPEYGALSPVYYVLRAADESVYMPYYDYVFKIRPFQDSLKRIGYGILDHRMRIPMTLLKKEPLPKPPLEEQKAIVAYLDEQTAVIHQFLTNKRRLIALLEEQKQVVINTAVTQGLETAVARKPSGIDWLGDIPTHWESKPIKRVAAILRGKFSHRPRNDPRMYDGKYPFIQTGNIESNKKYITEYHQTLSEDGYTISKEFPKGTLVMTITGSNTGNVAILNFVACFPDSIVGFVPTKDVDLDFLYYLFIAMKEELILTAPVNTQPNLNIEKIGALHAPFPSKEEQSKIVRYIEQKIIEINAAIERTQREIELIEEYRTTLIAHAVTGKIDVRSVV
ncbi:MAG: restriction endonuclease subunit S [Chloroflexota bacterium]